MPQVAERASYSDSPASIVVAGQSFGGQSSLYAGLRWPQRDMLQHPTMPDDAGWLIQHGLGHSGALKVFIEAGWRF
ncbi:hypothetical protein [Serratia symbiotica]|uniref:hypothetical protein n=1 Tax=Serratia symbiotica TaxID=138074 RepID=UPI003CC85553